MERQIEDFRPPCKPGCHRIAVWIVNIHVQIEIPRQPQILNSRMQGSCQREVDTFRTDLRVEDRTPGSDSGELSVHMDRRFVHPGS